MNSVPATPDAQSPATDTVDAATTSATKPSRQDSRSARRRARELAVQGLYSWLVNRDEASTVDSFLRDSEDISQADLEHYRHLLYGCISHAQDLDTVIAPQLDRPVIQLSQVEHAVLLVAVFELQKHPEIPYRVVLNEAIELTKDFGGTDGFRFVNGVLDRLAATLRPLEAQQANGPKRRPRNTRT